MGLPEIGPAFPREVLTVEEGAAWLTVSEECLRNLHRTRKVAGVKIGKHLRFRRADLQRYVEELTSET